MLTKSRLTQTSARVLENTNSICLDCQVYICRLSAQSESAQRIPNMKLRRLRRAAGCRRPRRRPGRGRPGGQRGALLWLRRAGDEGLRGRPASRSSLSQVTDAIDSTRCTIAQYAMQQHATSTTYHHTAPSRCQHTAHSTVVMRSAVCLITQHVLV